MPYLTETKFLKKFLEKRSIFPSKELGQNFLVDRNILKKIISVADLSKEDLIIEVGSGVGTLTLPLSKKAKKVVAIEKDKKLIPLLKNVLQKKPNVKIVNDDILRLKFSSFLPEKSISDAFEKKYKVIANIPYYITSAIIRKFLEEERCPEFLLLMVQKEVAQRICALPPKMSVLSVSVQFFAKPEIIASVPKSSFWPQPKVGSAIIKITPRSTAFTASLSFRQDFFKIVKIGFSHPRKQIGKNLSLLDKRHEKRIELDKDSLIKKMKELDIDPQRRAETLTIKEWILLTKKIRE